MFVTFMYPSLKKSCLYATFQPRKTNMLNEILQLPTQRLHVFSFSRKHVKYQIRSDFYLILLYSTTYQGRSNYVQEPLTVCGKREDCLK